MEQIIGIDLAKRVFHVHVVSPHGENKANKMITCEKLLAFIAQQPPSRIVMEACGSANYWTRQFSEHGHEVKQTSPQYVAPFRMGSKNDKNDAAAIVEADSRPGMRYVPDYLEDAENDRTTLSRQLFHEMLQELQSSQQNEDTLRLESIPGIGPTGASALTVALGDSNDFQNGRHFASYLGLVPREHSGGGKVRLLGITKRGDGYLRGLLIHGARSVVYRVINLPDEQCNSLQRWLKGLITRSGVNKAVVVLANKNARVAWALVN